MAVYRGRKGTLVIEENGDMTLRLTQESIARVFGIPPRLLDARAPLSRREVRRRAAALTVEAMRRGPRFR